MKNQKKYVSNNNGIHLGNPIWPDNTFCGQPMEGGWEEEGIAGHVSAGEYIDRGPVTCLDCIAMIKHARGVRTGTVNC